MRYRYRAYTGGPDPLAEPDPPTDGATRPLDELRALVAAAEPGSDADRADLTALEEALSRYGEGDHAALDEMSLADLRRLLGPEGEAARTRLDSADHGLGPRELRRLGDAALRDVERGRGALSGGRPVPTGSGGAAGEPTGAFVPHEVAGDRPLDAAATAREAALRRARSAGPALLPEDLRVAETEPETAAAVSLLIDLSHSMVTRSLHEAATRAALALHALVRTRHPGTGCRWSASARARSNSRPPHWSSTSGAVCPAPTCTTPCAWPGATCGATAGSSPGSWWSPTASPPPTWTRTATRASPGPPLRARSR